jgi:hypothetical protein
MTIAGDGRNRLNILIPHLFGSLDSDIAAKRYDLTL